MKKISVNMPSDDLVEGYLTEIARGYSVQWNSNSKKVSEDQSSEAQGLVVSGLDGRGGGTWWLIITRTQLNKAQEI
jgi:hypothetical protein